MSIEKVFHRGLVAVVLLISATAGLHAEEGDVVGVEAAKESDGTWRFSVTVSHPDEGWEHYVDRWDIVAPDGRVLGIRVLLHPHVQEQPFTRALGGVVIPEDLSQVTIRAHCSVDANGGQERLVTLLP